MHEEEFKKLKRETFRKVEEHLLNQKETSIYTHHKEHICGYRGINGLKCAVGCLISDSYYSESLENKTPQDLPVLEAVTNSLGVKLDRGQEEDFARFLMKLQMVHDVKDPIIWGKELKEFESKYLK